MLYIFYRNKKSTNKKRQQEQERKPTSPPPQPLGQSRGLCISVGGGGTDWGGCSIKSILASGVSRLAGVSPFSSKLLSARCEFGPLAGDIFVQGPSCFKQYPVWLASCPVGGAAGPGPPPYCPCPQPWTCRGQHSWPRAQSPAPSCPEDPRAGGELPSSRLQEVRVWGAGLHFAHLGWPVLGNGDGGCCPHFLLPDDALPGFWPQSWPCWGSGPVGMQPPAPGGT